MTEVTELLTEARARIARGWTQGASARDVTGSVTRAWAEEAVCWCAMGAVACRDDDWTTAEPAWAALRAAVGGETWVSEWNDAPGRTQADVLALYDRAIERSRSMVVAGGGQ